jgi:hypothetical protein
MAEMVETELSAANGGATMVPVVLDVGAKREFGHGCLSGEQ